jgi:hypothetical protein
MANCWAWRIHLYQTRPQSLVTNPSVVTMYLKKIMHYSLYCHQSICSLKTIVYWCCDSLPIGDTFQNAGSSRLQRLSIYSHLISCLFNDVRTITKPFDLDVQCLERRDLSIRFQNLTGASKFSVQHLMWIDAVSRLYLSPSATYPSPPEYRRLVVGMRCDGCRAKEHLVLVGKTKDRHPTVRKSSKNK